jgi:hypothetical protein
MHVIKDIFMVIRSIGILYLFYLQFTHSVSVPLLVTGLIAVGSIGSAIFCTDVGRHFFGRKLINYLIGILGIVIVVNQSM